MAIYGIDMGHSISGIGGGAVGVLSETVENRKVGKRLIELLQAAGHKVVNCTVDSASSVNAQLSGIVQKANAQKLDLFVSIHFNSGGGRGAETYVVKGSSASAKAKAVNDEIVKACGFVNRGVKNANFYVIANTSAPAMLIEVCFVDSAEDKSKYDAEKVAQAIFRGITGAAAPSTPVSKPQPSAPSSTNEIIKQGQAHANNFAGCGLVVDGIPGANTNKAKIKVLQQGLNCDYKAGLVVDGIWGTRTSNALSGKCIQNGSRGHMVTALEILLMLNGYDPKGVESPGIFGSGLTSTVKAYQSAHGLAADGMAGVNTFKKLIGV